MRDNARTGVRWIGMLLVISLLLPISMTHALPKITREDEAEAADRVAVARKQDRDGATTAYVPPKEIDGIPMASYGKLMETRFSSASKRQQGREGHRLGEILPLKDIRSMFLSAYSPNGMEVSDKVIFAVFKTHVVGPKDAFKFLHYGPGREIYIVTKKGEPAILYLYLGSLGQLVYQDGVYNLVPRVRDKSVR